MALTKLLDLSIKGTEGDKGRGNKWIISAQLA
jgi:hypothetical protein